MNIFFKFFFAFLCFVSPLRSSEFYALLIGDTSEKTIASLVKADLKKMKKQITHIAACTEQQLHVVVLQGSGLTLDRLQAALDQLHPGPDDTVFFYQTSHGFRTPEKQGNWPILFFSSHNIGIYFESINELLLNKKPRLLISLVNACNSLLPKELIDPNHPIEIVTRSKIEKQDNPSIYKQLFANTSGAVIASSSKSGQESFGLDHTGSFFTISFIKVLKKAASGEISANWHEVMNEVVNETKRQAKTYNCNQKPQFIILEKETTN